MQIDVNGDENFTNYTHLSIQINNGYENAQFTIDNIPNTSYWMGQLPIDLGAGESVNLTSDLEPSQVGTYEQLQTYLSIKEKTEEPTE